MMATCRRISIHDFLLVAFSVAVIVLSNWPDAPPRQLVQLRTAGGELRQYSLAENDPQLAQLRLALEKWLKAGQETRLAVAQWRLELAEHYAAKPEADYPTHATSPFSPVSYRIPSPHQRLQGDLRLQGDRPVIANGEDNGIGDQNENGDIENGDRYGFPVPAQSTTTHRQYWLELGAEAQREIARVEEVRRSRKALEVTPPILFGSLEAGKKPSEAVAVAGAIGVLIASVFAGWVFACPPLRLTRSGPARLVPGPNSVGPYSVPGPNSDFPDSDFDAELSAATCWGREGALEVTEIRLEVPTHWVRLRQPWSVMIRRWAVAGLVLGAAAAVLLH